jgi:DNA-binding Lrp family transcriptional regulator
MGRPLLQIDEDTVEKLAGLHCTMKEIAAFVGCSVDTLENRFSELIEQGREKGKISLRRKQYDLAMKGNATMLIWLGKQNLGQTERSRDEIDVMNRFAQMNVQPMSTEQLADVVKLSRGVK